jgi:hypothetical protein
MGGSDRVVALGGCRRDARGGARGSSPELNLALAPVAASQQRLLLCGLWRMGVLTMVFVGIDGVGRGLAMRTQTRGKTARMGGGGL